MTWMEGGGKEIVDVQNIELKNIRGEGEGKSLAQGWGKGRRVEKWRRGE